jgi:hypothetical protein
MFNILETSSPTPRDYGQSSRNEKFPLFAFNFADIVSFLRRYEMSHLLQKLTERQLELGNYRSREGDEDMDVSFVNSDDEAHYKYL